MLVNVDNHVCSIDSYNIDVSDDFHIDAITLGMLMMQACYIFVNVT